MFGFCTCTMLMLSTELHPSRSGFLGLCSDLVLDEVNSIPFKSPKLARGLPCVGVIVSAFFTMRVGLGPSLEVDDSPTEPYRRPVRADTLTAAFCEAMKPTPLSFAWV